MIMLKLILNASSNEGDLVLDCFCGSGTTLLAAQELNRKWIGIDQSNQAIKTVKRRLDGIPANLFSKVEFELLEQIEKDLTKEKKIQTQSFFDSREKIKFSLQPGQSIQ